MFLLCSKSSRKPISHKNEEYTSYSKKKENKELNNIATDNESMLERLTKYCNLLFENKLKDIKKMIQ